MLKRPLIAILAVIGLIAGVVLWQSIRPADLQSEFAAARREQFAEPARAYERCLTILSSSPENRAALVLAADLAERLDRPLDALEHARRLAAATPGDTESLSLVARLALKSAHVTEACSVFRTLTEIEPRNAQFQRQYADLLLSLGRRLESLPPLFTLVRNRTFLLDELVMLGAADEMLEDRQLLELALKVDSEKAASLTGLGRLEAYSNRFSEAADLFQQALDSGSELSPDTIPSLGRALLSANLSEPLRTWASQQAPKSLKHPDTQFVLAQLAVLEHQHDQAVEHLNQTLQLNPNHRAACQLMGTVLAESGEPGAARLYLDRALLLDETERLLRRLLFKHREAPLMRRAAELMELLHRPTEAWAWWIALQTYHPQDCARAAENAARLAERAFAASSQVDPDVVRGLVYRGQLSARDATSMMQGQQPRNETAESLIRFNDVAPELGLTTPYYGGHEGEPRGLWLYQVSGGGVSVTDIDADGHPDLYFVHGSKWPLDASEPRNRNRIFRQRNGRFADVSTLTEADDPGLGQSAAVGDADSDGFEDLYVANIGTNRLLRNNGDGTYSDMTPPEHEQFSHWTTNGLLADLNGDGFDDLFDVNYLAGLRPFEHVCVSGADQLVRACGPDIFAGEPDQCLISDGMGGFRNVTSAAGIQDSVGPGLGLVAADFDQSGTLDLFVANDMTANLFLVNRGSVPEPNAPSSGTDASNAQSGTKTAAGPAASAVGSGIPQFTDEAILRGCALNGSGRAEACMGIAAGDVTEDGYLDLFVTNFIEETNTLYSFTTNGFFEDRTAPSGIAEGSLQMLSFGTQFIDADLDGHQDVVLVNGHVDDYSHLDIPWKMRPAAYRNEGIGQFRKLADDSLGNYGLVERLGRAMARLDWDSDGRDDLVITHLDGPPALLANQSPPVGRSLAICFSGTVSSRTGIGAIIRIDLVDSTGKDLAQRVFHLSGGDGYYCSNQRRITIGLGLTEQVRQISIRWLSGTEQLFTEVTPGSTYRIVEGRSELYRLDEPATGEP